MADQIGCYGGVYDITSSDRQLEMPGSVPTGDTPWSLEVVTGGVVYIEWDSATADATKTERDNRIWRDLNKTARIPQGITSFAVKTATGTAQIAVIRA